MLCDIDLCLGCNDCIDIKCDIVFVIPLVTNNNYINSGNFVNSAMLPPSLMVFIPFLYCGIFLNSTAKRVTRVMRLTRGMRVM